MDTCRTGSRIFTGLLCLLCACSRLGASESVSEEHRLRWDRLPELSAPCGDYGVGLGAAGGVLLAAGGVRGAQASEEIDVPGSLQDAIAMLSDPDGRWQVVGRLPRPVAFGASVNWNDGVLLVGGTNEDGPAADVLLLQWSAKERRVVVRRMPPLPRPCTRAGAAVLGNSLYVVGGEGSRNAASTVNHFWVLDLSEGNSERQWQSLAPWPGPARIEPVLAAQDGAVLVMGGFEPASRRYQRDAYRYAPKRGWRRITDVPDGLCARATVPFGQTHLLVFGQTGGRPLPQAEEPRQTARATIYAYHTITDTWTALDDVPDDAAVLEATRWEDSIVVIGHSEGLEGARSVLYQATLVEPPRHFYGLDYAVVIVYLVTMVLVGVFFSRRTKSTADFFLASGRIPWWLAGIAIRATQISSIGLMAIPAKAYATNWVYILGVFIIVPVAPIIVYCYIPFFSRLRVTTAYEFLEERFNVVARMFGSAVFVLFQLGRVAIVMFLPALALSAVTGIDVYVCILTAGVICVLYTVMGGIEAIMWTDLVQEIILVGGPLCCVVIAILGSDGGLAGFFETAYADGKFHMLDWGWDRTAAVVWVVVLGNFFICVSTYSSDQVVVQRYLATRDETQAARAIWLNALFTVPWALLVFALGTALYTFYRSHPELLEIGSKTDAIVPLFVAHQLPAGITGLVIAAVFAATMSTVDSGIHSMSTTIVTDFYRRTRPQSTDKYRLLLARVLTVLLGAFATGAALLMATYDITSLWDLFFKLVGLVSSGLGGLFALGVFTRRTNGPGALVGVAVSATLLYFVQNYTHLHFFLYPVVGFVVCFVVGYLASLVIPAARKELTGLTIYTLHD